MIVIPKLKIAYQNVPKNGTSTLFDWLYVCVMGHEFRRGEEGGHDGHRAPRKLFLQTGEHSHLIENRPDAVAGLDDYIKFAVTRDPIQRFLSMYSGRVLYMGELDGSKPQVGERLTQMELEPSPDVNTMVDYLEAYCEASPSVGHHTLPMVHFLGKDVSVYDRLVDISSLGSFIGELQQHFASIGQTEAAAVVPKVKNASSQRVQRKIRLDELNPYSFEKLLDYYADDYRLIPTVDVEKVKSSYLKARGQVSVRLSGWVSTYRETAEATKKKREKRMGRRGSVDQVGE